MERNKSPRLMFGALSWLPEMLTLGVGLAAFIGLVLLLIPPAVQEIWRPESIPGLLLLGGMAAVFICVGHISHTPKVGVDEKSVNGDEGVEHTVTVQPFDPRQHHALRSPAPIGSKFGGGSV
jgi:hypothetical protein